VVAIRPSTGAERVLWCFDPIAPIESSPLQLTASETGVLITAVDSTGCVMRLLRPDGFEVDQVRAPSLACQIRWSLVGVGNWVAYLSSDGGPLASLVATDGMEQVQLGAANAPAVPCHGWLYWLGAHSDEESFGTQVLRWRPGSTDIEIVRKAAGGEGFHFLSCGGGTLAVPVSSNPNSGVGMTSVLVRDRP
jgi:hypothetical protein